MSRPHPGWAATRVLLALATLAEWAPRWGQVPERYSTDGALLAMGPLPIPLWHPLSPPEAWALYGAVLAGAVLLLTNRANRAAILLITLPASVLLFHEWANTKAHDRLLMWCLGVLFCAPGGGRGDQPTTPHATVALRLVFCALYGATGLNKLLVEHAWLHGDALAWQLLTPNFGNSPVDVLVSTWGPVLAVLGWFTVAFEVLFPALSWVRRARPWLLLAGAAMHLGIHALLSVGAFSWIALAAYPAMLAPDEAEAWRARGRRWLGRAPGPGA